MAAERGGDAAARAAYAIRVAHISRDQGIPEGYGVQRRMELQFEAPKLVSIGHRPDGGDVQLAPQAAESWQQMSRAADRARVGLVALSGFRSVERQVQIIQQKLAAGTELAEVLRYIAAPGYSEHHSGLALDLGTPGEIALQESFAVTPAFRWLESNASRYRFKLSFPRANPHGISFEPWHWCYF